MSEKEIHLIYFRIRQRYVILYLSFLCILHSLVVCLFLYCGIFSLSGLMQSLGGTIRGIKSKMCATKISEQWKNRSQKCFSKQMLSPSDLLLNVDDSLLVLQWCARKGSLPRTRQAPVIRTSQSRSSTVTVTNNINLCWTF